MFKSHIISSSKKNFTTYSNQSIVLTGNCPALMGNYITKFWGIVRITTIRMKNFKYQYFSQVKLTAERSWQTKKLVISLVCVLS